MGYGYKQVEAALVLMYRSTFTHPDFESDVAVREFSEGAIRGRLKNFQKLGISPARPGTGKRIHYQFEDLLLWAFCLELAECGLDPKHISLFIKLFWSKILSLFNSKKDNNDDVLLSFRPAFLSRWLIQGQYQYVAMQNLMDVYCRQEKDIWIEWPAEEQMLNDPHDHRRLDDPLGALRRVTSINLSSLERTLAAALAAAA